MREYVKVDGSSKLLPSTPREENIEILGNSANLESEEHLPKQMIDGGIQNVIASLKRIIIGKISRYPMYRELRRHRKRKLWDDWI